MSIWAMPSGDAVPSLRREIDRLATAAGSPPFEPHITLAGDDDGLRTDIAERLGRLRTFDVDLVEVAHSDYRFRCITLTAVLDESLAAARAAAGEDSTTFEPHLSLLYAELPSTERRSLIASIELVLPIRVTIQAIALVETRGEIAGWQPQQTFLLHDRR